MKTNMINNSLNYMLVVDVHNSIAHLQMEIQILGQQKHPVQILLLAQLPLMYQGHDDFLFSVDKENVF